MASFFDQSNRQSVIRMNFNLILFVYSFFLQNIHPTMDSHLTSIQCQTKTFTLRVFAIITADLPIYEYESMILSKVDAEMFRYNKSGVKVTLSPLTG